MTDSLIDIGFSVGNDELDAISLPEPDLSVYDRLPPSPMTRNPGEPPPETEPS